MSSSECAPHHCIINITTARHHDGRYSNFQINDAVHVERGDSQQLEGVVAYLGKVQFSQGDDWVGVRLTGTSVGLGKNDGSVQGVSYFQSGPNGGVFVRKANVSKRELTKLEALRLKRELAKKSAGITSPRPTAAAAASTSSRTPTTRQQGLLHKHRHLLRHQRQ